MPGSDVTDAPSDQAEIRGDLPDMLREIDVRIRTGVTTSQRRVTMMRDQLNADYPIPAVRELMMNAIMHRDYESTAPVRFYWFSDRIEIQNSGGLYGDAVLGEFPSSNAYRNPVIAEAMKTTGYVNRFGFGVRMVFRVLEENGNPPPEYEIDRHFVRVTVRPRLTPPSLRT